MSAVADIVARYGVDPNDEEAVDRFFDERAPELSPEEQETIVNALLNAEGEGDSPPRRRYAIADPNVSFKNDLAVEVPAHAVHPSRDAGELASIARSLKSCVSAFITLADLDVIVNVNARDEGRLELILQGREAERLNSDLRGLLDSIRLLTDRIVHVHHTVDEVDVIVRRTTDDEDEIVAAS